ncbi:hypothetical protein [Alteromonas macleodii]|uniref:hypothetical protein n=1 Tax=Alteromonas macleodii TaxID=28108 RepID=UPI00313AE2E9
MKEEYKGKRQLMPKPTSPAMRLNLSNRVYKAEDILSFSFNNEMFKKNKGIL